MPVDIVTAGRFAPSAWVVVTESPEYVDLGWSESGTGRDYRFCGRFAKRAAAEGAMQAAEAETLLKASDAMSAAGFVKEAPGEGFSTRDTVYKLRPHEGGRSLAWVQDQLMETHVMIPGTDGPYSSVRFATVRLPEACEERPCAFMGHRPHGALVIAMLMGAWEGHGKTA